MIKRAHVLEEIQLDVFESLDGSGPFAQQFPRTRVRRRQTFHAGAEGAADAFLGGFDHNAVRGGGRLTV